MQIVFLSQFICTTKIDVRDPAMCGIWAIFGCDQDVSKQCNSALKIAHRGPDSFRIEKHFNNCYLAFHRLVIVDDIYGMQPMRVRSHPHIYVLYNGEIYNYRTVWQQFLLCNFSFEFTLVSIKPYERDGVQQGCAGYPGTRPKLSIGLPGSIFRFQLPVNDLFWLNIFSHTNGRVCGYVDGTSH